jgi:hypothetical protein
MQTKEKVFHAVRYAEQSIEYLNRYYDKKLFLMLKQLNYGLEVNINNEIG